MKELSLQFKGYKIKGTAHLTLWGGDQGSIRMTEVFIPCDKLSPTAIKKAVNDGGFGCEFINEAVVNIYKCYGPETNMYEQYDRTIVLNFNQLN